MRIAIITMHCPLNYGAVLQAYALQRYLTIHGHSAFTIDYRPQYIIHDQNLFHIGNPHFNRNFLTRALYILAKLFPKIFRKRQFNRFIKNEIALSTKKYNSSSKLSAEPPKADLYICGSDQIWNQKSKSCLDGAFLLDFIPLEAIGISYAASGIIDSPIPRNIYNYMIPKIRRLKFISVREPELASLFQPHLNSEIKITLDPIFLLSPSAWRKLYKKQSKKESTSKYILVYPIGDDQKVIDSACSLSLTYNLPIYSISSTLKRDKRVAKYITCSPYDFLQLVDNASFVVTNSFHGCAFSIVFQKIFWVCETQIANHRIVHLLKSCQLSKRIIHFSEEISSCDTIIDYRTTEQYLTPLIQNSKSYLDNVIKVTENRDSNAE
uniref:polysaccharide pyruvyl transferase family protein n=1 Tax=Alistipes sp. TaxID=1872444 RepID=UPI004055BB0E